MDILRTQLAQRKENPEAFFSDKVERIISDGHPRYKPFDLEDIDKIGRDETIKFLHTLSNPGDYVFVCAGNLEGSGYAQARWNKTYGVPRF